MFFEFVAEVAGPASVDRYRKIIHGRYRHWYEATPEERLRRRLRRPPWWGIPTRVIDRAASMVPALFRERMDDWGIDFSIVFPSNGFTLGRDAPDPDFANGLIRAYNTMAAEMFRPHADRIVPVGVVSLYEPKTAIEQLEHARSVGLKLVTMGGSLPRTIMEDADWQPDSSKRRVYIDGLGLDSPYDYDPVWKKFMEVKMPVLTHVGSMGWPDRTSPNNFVSNHLGHFAQSHHLFARSLVLGGVTERFPNLRFAFLEGGVGWACNLYSDLIGHWEKRNKKFLDTTLKPTILDRVELRRLMEKYAKGHKRLENKIDEIIRSGLDIEYDMPVEELVARDLDSDDFSHVKAESKADIERLFARNFYFGCEADDPMTAVAFNKKMGLRLKPILGSDISHFDVVDATEVIEEAWEMVEHGLIDEQDFREFTFTNAARLCSSMNSAFFDRTGVADAVDQEISGLKAA